MHRVLYIAQCSPYDSVRHAGGQTLIYYLSRLSRNQDLKIDLLSFCSEEESAHVDVEKYGIEKHLIIRTNSLSEKLGLIYSIPSKINPYHKYADFSAYATHLLKKNIMLLKKEGKEYDCVFLEWTHIVLHIGMIKEFFPEAFIIGSEPDVSYLGYQRKADLEKSFFKNSFKKRMTLNMKRRELTALGRCDFIYVQNEKDKRLLQNDGIESNKIGIMTPYYHEFEGNRDYSLKSRVIFYGQMSRIENSDAAIWFIDNVMPRIQNVEFEFIIIGSSPPEKLIKLVEKTENVVLTGFVDDVAPFFYSADLFVCPLLLGAGIKVKVLEALYTGIPVLTNEIGIEGIPASPGKDYIRCNTAEEFANCITSLMVDEKERQRIGENGKEVINSSFNLSRSFDEYKGKLLQMLEVRKSQHE